MSTGFWPDDWVGPLTVKITAIVGADFVSSEICPPALGWNTTTGQDLFMTLTKVAELADKLQKDEGALSQYAFGLVFLCCCCGGVAMAVAACMHCMRRSQSEGFESEFQGPAPPQYGQGPPQYGQAQFAQPPVMLGHVVVHGKPAGGYQPGMPSQAMYQPGMPHSGYQPGVQP